jgi:lipoprotein-anchoring transpeptidase ErfK/SrfK
MYEEALAKRALEKINQTVEVCACTRRRSERGVGSLRARVTVQSVTMRIFASACARLCVAASAASLLIASDACAQTQPLLDPGWQIGYPVPSGGGGAIINGGFLQYMYGNGGGQVVIQRAYQPAPVYYQTMPAAPQVRGYQAAPVYYQMVAAPQTRAYQPAPVYYQAVPQQSAYQTAPVAYQGVPAPQQDAYRNLPVSIHQLPASQQSTEPPAQTQRLASARQPEVRPPLPPAPPEPVAQLQLASVDPAPGYAPSSFGDMMHPAVDPKYERQIVDYQTDEPPGTIVIDTPRFFLYLVMEGGKAMRYGIGVARQGFTWAGMKQVSAMREWPDWYPPDEMLKRRPDLPKYMAGGPQNPLGARAIYLGSTLYRIHGSNEPWTIGTQVSSGCIRLRNEDVIDLYGRVTVGTKVMVI